MLGGCLLVTLGLLAEYGAFEIVQFQTFTVQIFTEFKLGFDAAAACTLSLVLVAISVAVLAGELALGGPRPGVPHRPRRRAHGLAGAARRARVPALARARARWSGSRSACRSATIVYWIAPRRLLDAAADLDPPALGHTAALQRRGRGDLDAARRCRCARSRCATATG